MDDLLDSIEELNYEELITLNRAIAARVKEIRTRKTQAQLRQFQIGDEVQFMSSEGDSIEGTIVRFNKKTISVDTRNGGRWKVSPSYLTKLVAGTSVTVDQNVIELFD